MAAKYMVTAPPGAPVAGIGFITPGQVFTAPSDDYVPSRTFRPVNEEAKAALEKVFDARKDALQKALGEADEKGAKASFTRALKELEQERARQLDIVELTAPAPVVEDGLTLRELAELSSAPPSAAPAVQPAEKPTPATSPSSGKRAADR
jgi:Skp family chaperone for outer membrane proteins